MGGERAQAKASEPVQQAAPKKEKSRGGFIGAPDIERRGTQLNQGSSRRSRFLGA